MHYVASSLDKTDHLQFKEKSDLLAKTQGSSTDSIFQMASVFLHHPTHAGWWDWVQTQLSVDARLLRQLEWILVQRLGSRNIKENIALAHVRRLPTQTFDTSTFARTYAH
jgi:hypothetical protein